MSISICGRSGLWPFRFVAVSVCGRSGLWPFVVCGRFGLWPFRSVAVSVCGLFGLWPFRSVAFPVCGRFGLWPFRFWPFRFVAVMTRIPSYNQISPDRDRFVKPPANDHCLHDQFYCRATSRQ